MGGINNRGFDRGVRHLIRAGNTILAEKYPSLVNKEKTT
jgi:hypothetical protein